MPNTLAHLGIQAMASRAFVEKADLQWAYLGCVIPDIPWILQRFVLLAFPGVNPYDLRVYTIVQASLLFSIILSAALATLSRKFLAIFGILAFNSSLHLLLDSCEVKWANGVHLLAPVDWRLTNLGLFWPESPVIYLLTAFGLAYFVWNWRMSLKGPDDFTLRLSRYRALVFVLCSAVYLMMPPLLADGPAHADNHFVWTLENRHQLPGAYVELDRVVYLPGRSGSEGTVKTFAKEVLKVKNLPVERIETVSVRGTLVQEDTIQVHEHHRHHPFIRTASSSLGLILVAFSWMGQPVRRRHAGGSSILATRVLRSRTHSRQGRHLHGSD